MGSEGQVLAEAHRYARVPMEETSVAWCPMDNEEHMGIGVEDVGEVAESRPPAQSYLPLRRGGRYGHSGGRGGRGGRGGLDCHMIAETPEVIAPTAAALG